MPDPESSFTRRASGRVARTRSWGGSSGRGAGSCRGAVPKFPSAGAFSVKFPKDATPEDKAALFAGVMLLDYLFFDCVYIEQASELQGAPAAPETEMMAR